MLGTWLYRITQMAPSFPMHAQDITLRTETRYWTHLEAPKQGDLLAMLRGLRRALKCEEPAARGDLLRPGGSTFRKAVQQGCCLEVLHWLLGLGFPAWWGKLEYVDKAQPPALRRW